ncbi:hypothetical protein [Kribbella sp.]|uniref:hypothetical protein n=1 Tax=Kribbella sp. TaxID=1871183 RepID=UPI002D6855B0|nr:hypothetical protein [Kribbella sp.]HZX07201.1 hypothetical protein [Kribbella sp.]
MTIITTRGDLREHRDRANAAWLAAREPEALATNALLTLDPDRAGRDFRRSWIEPGLGSSAAERVEHVEHVEKFSRKAVELFGIDALEATARVKDSDHVCRWCLSWATARRNDRPTPHLRVGAVRSTAQGPKTRRAFEVLLGKPCASCRDKIVSESQRCDDLRFEQQRAKREQRAAPPPAAAAVTATLNPFNPAHARAVVASGHDPQRTKEQPAPTGFLTLETPSMRELVDRDRAARAARKKYGR